MTDTEFQRDQYTKYSSNPFYPRKLLQISCLTNNKSKAHNKIIFVPGKLFRSNSHSC